MNDSKNHQIEIDLQYMSQVCFGKVELMKQMIKIFIDQTPAQIDALRLHYANKDWNSFRSVAHKLKSSVAVLGNQSLSQDIEVLELSAAKEEGLEVVPEILERSIAGCEGSVEELKEKLKQL